MTATLDATLAKYAASYPHTATLIARHRANESDPRIAKALGDTLSRLAVPRDVGGMELREAMALGLRA